MKWRRTEVIAEWRTLWKMKKQNWKPRSKMFICTNVHYPFRCNQWFSKIHSINVMIFGGILKIEPTYARCQMMLKFSNRRERERETRIRDSLIFIHIRCSIEKCKLRLAFPVSNFDCLRFMPFFVDDYNWRLTNHSQMQSFMYILHIAQYTIWTNKFSTKN